MRPMLWVYNGLLVLGLLLGWPLVLVYLVLIPKARAGFFQKISLSLPCVTWANLSDEPLDVSGGEPCPNKPCLWMHAVSVGELNALQPVIASCGQWAHIVLTTTTQTAQNLARSRYTGKPGVVIRYFPYDVPWCLQRFIQTYQPDALLIAETELWPNAIDQMARLAGKPVMLVNGRLSPRSFPRYQRIKAFMSPMLKQISLIDAQSLEDAQRFVGLGALSERVVCSGNLKYHLPQQVERAQQQTLKTLLNLLDDDIVVTLASTRPGEEEHLLPFIHYIRQQCPQSVVVMAPRHPERAGYIAHMLNQAGLSCARRSQHFLGHFADRAPVLILDTIGELVTLYALSDVVVMGGSFVNHGGQNPLEPISQRAPVVVGPYMQNFKAIVDDLLAQHAIIQVDSVTALMPVVEQLLAETDRREALILCGEKAAERHSQVVETVVSRIREVLTGSLALDVSRG